MTTKEAVCKRIILSIFSLLALCRTAGAQDSQKATLTAADAGTCAATSTACLVINVPSGSGGATFNIGANASANTVQFEATADYGTTWVALSVTPSSSTTTVTSTTSTGAWQANVAGYTKVRVRCSTFVGGTTTTYINLSTASARSNGGGGSVTHTAGNLTAFHIMIGNGAADATVDSACVTNGTGALSGCTSISAGSGASSAGATATGGFACVEATNTGWTPTAGQDYRRCDNTLHTFVDSVNGSSETPSPVFSAVPAGSKCLQSSGVAGLIAEAAGACGTGAISGLTTGFLSKSLTATTIQNSLCDEGITVANALTCTDTVGIRAPAFISTGATAGFIDFPQGADSGAVAPCNTATSICWEAPTSVTSYKGILPGAAATGIPHYTNAANVITETIGLVTASDCTVCVVNNGTNTGTTAMTLDMSASTTASALKMPVGAGFTSAANGAIAYDTTAGATHVRSNGADSLAAAEAAAIVANTVPKATNSTNSLITASSMIDNGTNVTSTDTGGFVAPVFVSNGSTAGFVDYPQGSTSAAVAPCNAATSICEQAPTAVTSYLVTKPGVSATGITTNNVSAAVITQGISGDANHSATVTTGSGTSVGSTTLCSSTNCPAGTYVVHVYLDITTACSTTGTYVVNLIYTDDQGAKTIPVNLNGTGAVPATGVVTLSSTANFGENSQVIRLTSGNLNYSTTAGACGTGGPAVGKLYMAAVPVM